MVSNYYYCVVFVKCTCRTFEIILTLNWLFVSISATFERAVIKSLVTTVMLIFLFLYIVNKAFGLGIWGWQHLGSAFYLFLALGLATLGLALFWSLALQTSTTIWEFFWFCQQYFLGLATCMSGGCLKHSIYTVNLFYVLYWWFNFLPLICVWVGGCPPICLHVPAAFPLSA